MSYDEQLAMIRNSRLVDSPIRASTRLPIISLDEYHQVYSRSLIELPQYWAEVASQLEWYSPWTSTLEKNGTDVQWFKDGIGNVSVNCIDRHARHKADRTALIALTEEGHERRWTWGELLDATARAASAMLHMGIKKGDVVAIFLPNLLETVAAVHACFRIGAIYNVVFSGFSPKALSDRLQDTEAKLVITADESVRRGHTLPLKAKLDAIIDQVPSVQHVVVVRRTGGNVFMRPGRDLTWEAFLAGAPGLADPEPIEANEPGFIIYTSGTTAKPKGLVHSGLGFLVGTAHNVRYALDLAPHDIYWCTADVGWLTFPIFELVGGLAFGATYILYDGALDHPDAGRFYDIVSRYHVNKVFTAPTVLRSLARYGDTLLNRYDVSRLERLALVGEPLDAHTWQWVYEKLGQGHMEINNTYGQSETGSAWTSSIVGVTPAKPGSCGMPLPGHGCSVVDDAGQTLPPGQVGQLAITTPFPALARTIWHDPERYRDAYFTVPGQPYWYATHDAAVLDEDGHVWVLGRMDDVINVAAHRLSTMEMESAVLEVAAVAEAAVVGIPDPIKGEVPVAIVTTRIPMPQKDLEESVQNAITEQIGPIARPHAVVAVDNLPKTRSGKIVRRLLKDLLVGRVELGDVSGVENVEILEALRQELQTRL